MQIADVIAAVKETRPMLIPHWGAVDELIKDDGARSVVTELDLAIERYLQSRIAQLDPTAEFAGEEFGGSRDAARFWLCDPIDGTAHFVRGLPFCSVMLALIEEGRVNASIIYDFVNDDLYHAVRGGGAYRNGDPIRVSDRPVSHALVAFETNLDKPENIALRQRVREKCMILSSTTSGYEFALVASGKLEGRICVDPWGHDWDFAPGTLLVEEAGGRVANIGSSSYSFRNLNLIAGNPALFEALTASDGAVFPLRS